MTAAGHSVYVYGVVPAAECGSISLTGVEGAEVRKVEHAGVVALVSAVSGGSLTAAKEVRAHWRVLDEACGTTTVLPVRFGTVMESDDAVRAELLEPNAERLELLLREVSGRVQLNVKGNYDEERLMREVVMGSTAVAELRDRLKGLPAEAGYYERIRLGELVAAEVGNRRATDTRLALETIQGPRPGNRYVRREGTATDVVPGCPTVSDEYNVAVRVCPNTIIIDTATLPNGTTGAAYGAPIATTRAPASFAAGMANMLA